MIETPTLMEPMLPEEGNKRLEDLATVLVGKSSSLASSLRPEVRASVGDLVRSMNCYYSNLIEGHNTHPRDIDRAMKADYSTDTKKRELQLEAVAHIEVQRMVDNEDAANMVSMDYICWLHREFCSRLPDELLWVRNPDSGKKIEVVPGVLRDGDVQVGRHLAPRPDTLSLFLNRFSEAYAPEKLSKLRQIIAAGAAHHRLLWIHPFYDGNGRVTRLFSHAYLRHIGIGNSLWSISRGLARRVEDYKSLLMQADEPRRGDLDGRGSLTATGLLNFCIFFLEICIDQVDYMASILEPNELLRRMQLYCEDEIHAGRLPKGSFDLLREALLAGSFERGKADAITGYKERQARSVLAELVAKGLLISDSPKSPVWLGFPIDVVERWFPKLYPAV
jgi:Fic family protein